MEILQHAIEQSMCQVRMQKRNKKYLETMKMETHIVSKLTGCSKSNFRKEVHSSKSKQ